MKKIRFGVIGTNFISDWVIRGAREDSRFELVAVCSRKRETGESFAAKHGIPYVFTSVEEMATSELIDAVYIASPNFKHSEQSIVCMEHGKHVLCEKPLASNSTEVRRMIEASEKYGVTLMEAMKSTLLPDFRSVIRNIGRVGKVRRYFSAFCQYSSRYDRFKSGELPNAFNPAYSNGSVMDIGIYTIYPMVVLFGMPDKVLASGTVLSSGADGQGSVIFKYEDFDAVVIYSKISDSDLPTEIQGEDGIISIDHIARPERVTYCPRSVNHSGGLRDEVSAENITAETDKDPYYYEIAEFIDLVLSGKRESAVNSHTNSLHTIMLIDEIRRQTGIVYPADS